MEVFDDNSDTPVKSGSGRFIISSLLNKDMPLIRYDAGDRGRLNFEMQCQCGVGLPVIDSIEGRSNDLIVTRNGRRVFWINPAFYNLPLYETQVVQNMPGCIDVFYVPASGFTPETEKVIENRLRDRLGDMDICFKAVEQIPRSPGGKFRAVISKIDNENLEPLSGKTT
jgi:phenylacetate-CoA ligase